MSDKYFIDYRREEIIKNLDITYLAPEMYCEVEISDGLSDIYIYTYENSEGEKLDFSFRITDILESNLSFDEMLDNFFTKNNFKSEKLYKKLLYIKQEDFDALYKRS